MSQESFVEESSKENNIKPLTPQDFKDNPSLNELLSGQLEYLREPTDFLSTLLDWGADPNYVFKGACVGLSPLELACRQNNVGAVKLLLKRGADPKVNNPVFSIRSVAVAQVLLEAGANFNVKMAYGNTLLHTSCLLNLTDLAAFFIEQGLSINTQNEFGQTPVHFAFSRLVSVSKDRPFRSRTNQETKSQKEKAISALGAGHLDAYRVLGKVKKESHIPKIESGHPRELNLALIKLLLEAGGKYDQPDSFGWTAMDYAEGCGWKKQIENFLNGFNYDEDELFQTLREGKPALVLKYLAEGNKPDLTQRCESLVHIAANNGDCKTLGALIEHKANIDCRVKAAEFQEDALVGLTPLYSVCYLMGPPPRVQAMKMLIAAGAKVNTPCDNYLTPFLVLCQNRRKNAIRVMIQAAYDQLLSSEILPKFAFTKKKINSRFEFSVPPTRNEIGNGAVKTLCQMFVEDETEIHQAQIAAEEAAAGYHSAHEERKSASLKFEKERQNFEAGKISEEAFDTALNDYLESSRNCADARSKMIQMNDEASELVLYHQTQEYKVGHRQLGEVIQSLIGQIDCDLEVQKLIDSHPSLQRVCENSKGQPTL